MGMHTLRMAARVGMVALAGLLLGNPASAQNWSFDARQIALGGVGGAEDIGSAMIAEQRPYRAIVLPFGLLQVLKDLDVYKPDSPAFDPIRVAEYAASPLHYVVGRDDSATGLQLVSDVRNARLSRDLNAYQGFSPSSTIREGGISAPLWGGTIKFARRPGGAFQGLYIGAGPYLTTQIMGAIDDRLVALLGSETPVYVPNTTFTLSDTTTAQLALSIAGGYRGRFALPSGVRQSSEADGIYVAVNYRSQLGFRYEDADVGLRLDTDGAGLLTASPLSTPLAVTRLESSSGRGRAIDVGIGAVLGAVQLGFGANGLGNRITWRDVARVRYTLPSLLTGGGFVESPRVLIGDVEVEVPVDYRVHAGYNGEEWAGVVEYGRGFQGTTVRGGLERTFSFIALRGGARHIRNRWEPSGGLGIALTRRVGLDVAAFGTSANIERKRHLAIAASIRIFSAR
jgi:hypothetical protein